MHSRTEQLLQGLRDRRTILREAIDAAPEPLRAKRPKPDAWSVDEIAEHLALVEAGIVRLLGRMLREHRQRGVATQAGLAPTSLDPATVLDRSRRIVAGERVRPTGRVDAETSWQALAVSRSALEQLVTDAQGCDPKAVRAPHPAFGDLDLEQWIEFVGLHEARHAEQMREAIAELARPKAPAGPAD